MQQYNSIIWVQGFKELNMLIVHSKNGLILDNSIIDLLIETHKSSEYEKKHANNYSSDTKLAEGL